jgi:hypothetical protein
MLLKCLFAIIALPGTTFNEKGRSTMMPILVLPFFGVCYVKTISKL